MASLVVPFQVTLQDPKHDRLNQKGNYNDYNGDHR